MFINSHLQIPRGFTDVIRTVPFIDNIRSVNVFAFKVEKTLTMISAQRSSSKCKN